MPTSWLDDRSEYERIAHAITPYAKLESKDRRVWQVASWFLLLASCGQFSRQQFLKQFATTLGPIQAYPADWKQLSRSIVAHESRHTAQFLFAGWFVPLLGWCGPRVRVWIGVLPMALVYGFFPLPIFFCWGRFRLELDAEAFAWRIGLKQGWLEPADVFKHADRVANNVSSWAYLKAWPKPWARKAFRQRAEMEIARWQATQSSNQ